MFWACCHEWESILSLKKLISEGRVFKPKDRLSNGESIHAERSGV